MDGHATGIDGDQKGWRRVDRVALAREPLDAVRGVKSLTGVPDWGLRVLARGCLTERGGRVATEKGSC